VIPTVRIHLVVNNVNVAKVDNSGTITGIANGVAIIEARVGARRGQAAVQVPAAQPHPPSATGPPAATSGRQRPPARSVRRPTPRQWSGGPHCGSSLGWSICWPQRIRAFRRGPCGKTARRLRLFSLPGHHCVRTVASVDQSGNVVALSPGQGTIQATATGGLTATAPVVVQQAEFSVREGTSLMLSPGELDTVHVIVATQSNRTGESARAAGGRRVIKALRGSAWPASSPPWGRARRF